MVGVIATSTRRDETTFEICPNVVGGACSCGDPERLHRSFTFISMPPEGDARTTDEWLDACKAEALLIAAHDVSA